MKKTSSKFVKMLVLAMIVVSMVVLGAVTCFAADASITTAMLEPVLTGVTANIAVILPIAVGLFAIVLGIKFIPRIFKMFSKG